MDSLRDRATTGLRAAMRERDRDAMSALRSLLAAFDNGAAVPSTARAGAIEESAIGVGAAEVQRRGLDEDALRAIAQREIAEHLDGATLAADHGEQARADRLRQQAEVVRRLVADA